MQEQVLILGDVKIPIA
jgi:predicted phosphodiesterase